jgi:molybdate transport system substrate-binding protein
MFMAGVRSLRVVVAAISGLAAIAGTWTAGQAEVLAVGAPPSMRPALTEILPLFERENGATVRVEFTASKTLVRQIEKGAPIDVFLAAGVEEVDHLYKKGMTLNGKPRIYAQTSLVLVMSANSTARLMSFEDALPDRTIRIALGDPRTSSLGEVTALNLAKLSPLYKQRPRILYAPHSEDIIALIQTGKADVGLVYRVDTINSGQVRISDENPMERHIPVQFGQAVVWTCRAALRPVAEQFSNFLMTPRIQKLLIKYGFDPVSK